MTVELKPRPANHVEQRIRAACHAVIPHLLDHAEPHRSSLAVGDSPRILVEPQPVHLADMEAPQDHRGRGRPVRSMMGIAAAVTVVVGGLAAIAARQGEPAVTEQPSARFVPPGEEFPLTEIDLGSLPPTDPPVGFGRIAEPASVRVVTAAGLDGWTVVFQAIGYTEFSGTVHEFRCEEAPGHSGCVPMAGYDNLGARSGEREQWTTVPAGTAVVGYVDGAGRSYWQQPVGRVAIFPHVGADGVFTAYGENGGVIEVRDFTAYSPPAASPYGEAADTLTTDQREMLHDMTVEVLRDCLNQAGATYPNGESFPVLPATSRPDTWDQCVAATKHAVDQQFVNWAARLLPLDPPQPGTPISPATVERGMSAAAVILAGTEPACTTTDSELFTCTLSNPPFWDGSPDLTDAAFDYTAMIQSIVDDDSKVVGGCRASDAPGMHWTCYVGQRAVAAGVLGEGSLGQLSTGPASG